MTDFYRGYRIDYNPPPIPIREHDYQFAHEDYDGSDDRRFGTGSSVEDCKDQIDRLIEKLWRESEGLPEPSMTDESTPRTQEETLEADRKVVMEQLRALSANATSASSQVIEGIAGNARSVLARLTERNRKLEGYYEANEEIERERSKYDELAAIPARMMKRRAAARRALTDTEPSDD